MDELSCWRNRSRDSHTRMSFPEKEKRRSKRRRAKSRAQEERGEEGSPHEVEVAV